jgi:hypothetical protein
MSFLDRILGRNPVKHHFPYSSIAVEKRKQIWDNLQVGIMLEDQGIFLPWSTPYSGLDRYTEKRTDQGDRSLWYLGHRRIMDGITCHIEVMKWSTQPWSSTFDKFSENLGQDEAGFGRFKDRTKYLTELLGEPTKKELEKFGSFDLGDVTWRNGAVEISLVGIEIFSCRYSLNVGLMDNSHDRDQKKAMDDLRAQGWTEEDFGK